MSIVGEIPQGLPSFKIPQFSWEIIEGDRATALAEPNSIVLTKTSAQKYYGDESPIGQIMLVDNQFELKVTAVMEDVPQNSHFHVDFLAPMVLVESFYGGSENFMGAWGSNNFATFFLLKEGYPYLSFQDSLFVGHVIGHFRNFGSISHRY